MAKRVITARFAMNPDLAASVGLFDDAMAVPSYTEASVRRQAQGLERDIAELERMSQTGWTLEARHDHRWLLANAAEAHRRLTVERPWKHRYAEYLEPVANTLISLTTYAPERVELRLRLARALPAMLTEMLLEVTEPTQRDVTTAQGLLDGLSVVIAQLPPGAEAREASSALQRTRATLGTVQPTAEFAVIGAENYGWRLREALLLPWDIKGLQTLAEAELARVDARLATLTHEPIPELNPEQQRAAEQMNKASFLALYTDSVSANLERLRAMNVVTLPADFPPMYCRETPDALIPLTGDGGSMNPPLMFGPRTPGWWNVQHWAEWPLSVREDMVRNAAYPELGLGPYAVHEGVPGHHLQLSLTRGVSPLRAILTDTPSVEGWALYAEQLFWEGGGFGASQRAEAAMLRSYRGRIRRVVYDVQVETGAWSLDQASAWKHGSADVEVDPDVLRAINWPTQLISYFAGKAQIVALRDEIRVRDGARYDERAFHDAFLAEGPIPVALVREKLLAAP